MAVQDTVSPSPNRQDFDSLAVWFRLARTLGISRLTANLLLAEYGSPQAVLAAARAFDSPAAGASSSSDATAAHDVGNAPDRSTSHGAAACEGGQSEDGKVEEGEEDWELVAGDSGEGADTDEDAEPYAYASANAGAEAEAEAGVGGEARRSKRKNRPPRVVVRDGDRAVMTAAAARLLNAPLADKVREEIEAALVWQNADDANNIITLEDAAYPPTLRHIPDPPLVLYVKGRYELLQKDALAIVGSRNATHSGKLQAQEIARAVAGEGLAIVSGLALGIDAAAHVGGLQAPGSTIAIVGTGIDRIYPSRNADLARRIAKEGCLISEFALGASPQPQNFPIRNRIIAGMARATLVVEATARSGSRITAHQAMNFGREVLVMPGSAQSPFSQGCHALIREGARLAANAQHVLEDLGLRAPESIPFMLTGTASELLEQLSYDPVSADELAARLQLNPSDTQASLLALELAGVVERLPGGAFQRCKV